MQELGCAEAIFRVFLGGAGLAVNAGRIAVSHRFGAGAVLPERVVAGVASEGWRMPRGDLRTLRRCPDAGPVAPSIPVCVAPAADPRARHACKENLLGPNVPPLP